jgi:hypothetical protein
MVVLNLVTPVRSAEWLFPSLVVSEGWAEWLFPSLVVAEGRVEWLVSSQPGYWPAHGSMCRPVYTIKNTGDGRVL